MPRSTTIARRALAPVALLLCLVTGCGPGSAAAPSTEAARQALASALSAWAQGKKPGELPGVEPLVFVHDTPWSQGQQLGSYEILGEEEGAAAEKRFTVRLTLAQPERTEEVRYHVLGTDPVMVFRDEDYQRNINMENGPSTAETPRRGRRPR